jgi:flagellar basal-body rod protein FlgB
MNITNNPFGIHETALRARSERLELLAKNIANADTPQFKARDIDFKQALLKSEKQTMRATHTNHFEISQTAGGNDALKYRVPFNASADGNTVEMPVEQANYGRAAADYRATLSFIQEQSNSIKRALRGD